MKINERLKFLRKELELNQEEFGERINLNRATIALLETGARNITERNIKLICEKFSINEKWLKEGIGEMYSIKESELLEKLSIQHNLTETDKEIINGYMQLNEKERESVKKFILQMASKIAEGEKKEEQSLTSEKKNNA